MSKRKSKGNRGMSQAEDIGRISSALSVLSGLTPEIWWSDNPCLAGFAKEQLEIVGRMIVSLHELCEMAYVEEIESGGCAK